MGVRLGCSGELSVLGNASDVELLIWHQLCETSQKILSYLIGLNIIFKKSFIHSFIHSMGIISTAHQAVFEV